MSKKDYSFELNSLVLFIMMMLSNICNYLFQIIVGNLVQIEEYAQINTVLSLIAILTIPTSIITIICARYMAISSSDAAYSQVIRTLLIFSSIVVIIMMVFVLPLTNHIKAILSLYSNGYIYGTLAVSIFTIFNAIFLGILQGRGHFFEYGIENLIASVGKMCLSAVLVLLGMKVYGVIAAILIGLFLAVAYGFSRTKSMIIPIFEMKEKNYIDKREFFKYSIGAVIAQGTVILLTNGDMLLVKAFFQDREAGLYSSAMVIGKIVMYVSTAVVATMFPAVAQRANMKQDTKILLKKALLYGGGVAIICALLLVLMGKPLIGVFFGKKYLEAFSIVPSVCFYVVPLTFVTILMNYLLALNKTKLFNTIMLLAVVTIVSVCFFFHRTLKTMISTCGVILLFALILCIIIIWIKGENQHE